MHLNHPYTLMRWDRERRQERLERSTLAWQLRAALELASHDVRPRSVGARRRLGAWLPALFGIRLDRERRPPCPTC